MPFPQEARRRSLATEGSCAAQGATLFLHSLYRPRCSSTQALIQSSRTRQSCDPTAAIPPYPRREPRTVPTGCVCDQCCPPHRADAVSLQVSYSRSPVIGRAGVSPHAGVCGTGR
jgi:hypothetical protein